MPVLVTVVSGKPRFDAIFPESCGGDLLLHADHVDDTLGGGCTQESTAPLKRRILVQTMTDRSEQAFSPPGSGPSPCRQ